MDLIAILLVTPLSDRFHNHRALFFSAPVVLQIVGLVVVSYGQHPWPRYVGLLIVGFGLGPTVPICMTWAKCVLQLYIHISLFNSKKKKKFQQKAYNSYKRFCSNEKSKIVKFSNLVMAK